MKSKLVSIVIPVYNEGQFLDGCLKAIANQTVMPLEVIVVDNNSNDSSIKISSKYRFARVVKETRQGVIFARNKGFDLAKGKIIGRIDADSHIQEDWVETVENIFKDKNIDAVSGGVYYYDVISSRLSYKFDLFFRKDLAIKLKNEAFLQGSNMAIKKELWNKVKDKTCTVPGIHEDLDLAIHSTDLGAKVVFYPKLVAGVSLRRYEVSFKKFYQYIKVTPFTYRYHNKKSASKFNLMFIVLVLSYWIILLAHLVYDPKTSKISLLRPFNYKREDRVDPTVFTS